MIESIFSSLLTSFIAQLSLGATIVIGCVAAGYFFPPVRRLAAEIAVGTILFGVIANHFFSEGKAYVQAKWDAAEQRAVVQGEKARTDAEHYVDGTSSWRLQNNRHDKFNRDPR